jgi:hypothetical protein
MSEFANDLTNFWGFPALGAIIVNYLGWESTLTFKIDSNFMILDPDWAFF